MRYDKPTIELVGDAQTLVQGTKCKSPHPDNVYPCFIQSVAAYEADE